MKKVLLFAIVLGGAVAFTSCGSDECTCTIAGQSETFTEDDVNGGDLEAACETLDALYKISSADNGCSM